MVGEWHDPPDISEVSRLFEAGDYIADEQVLTSVFLALRMKKPLLVEGEPGCGKTEIAKVLAKGMGTELIRLQCYEGLDSNSVIYEWDYLRQLLKIKIEEGKPSAELEPEIFSERFLLKRPLLRALSYDGTNPPVLLIDEIDRADEEFEGLLLEFLAEFQVTVPEIGTFSAKKPPIVIVTSNRTRELGDGLRRRCLYLHLTYPAMEKELKIVKLKTPGISDGLASQIVTAVSKIRTMERVVKRPGVAETLDWASAIVQLGRQELDLTTAEQTLACAIKNPDDLGRLKGEALASAISSPKET